MPLIRALAYHVDPRNPLEDSISRLDEASEVLDRLVKNIDLDVWSRRLVLPELRGRLNRLSIMVEEAAGDEGFDYAAIPLGSASPETITGELIEALKNTTRVFFNYKVADLNVDPCNISFKPVISMLRRIAVEAGPDACTRFALAYGGPPETPYFPDCASRRQGVSACLRYAGDLQGVGVDTLKESVRQVLGRVSFKLEEACRSLGVRYVGLDASLSPWMDESVARIIENISGSIFGGPGTLSSIYLINRLIEEFSAEFRLTGFNEVMLPLAEDSRLIELAEKRLITASTLTSLISVSVSGLDMVALPLSLDYPALSNLLRDAFTLAYRKQKPIGVRLILADLEPYEYLELQRFTMIPVVPP